MGTSDLDGAGYSLWQQRFPRFGIRVGVPGFRTSILAFTEKPGLLHAVSGAFSVVREVATAIDKNLQESFGLSPTEGPIVRFISSLAPGADSLLARQALKQGFELQSILPYSAAERALDFADERAKEEFDELLAVSTVIVQLDGCSTDPEGALAVATNTVMDESDLLFVLSELPLSQFLENLQRLGTRTGRNRAIIGIDAKTFAYSALLRDSLCESVTLPKLKELYMAALTAEIMPTVKEREAISGFMLAPMPNIRSGILFNTFRDFVAGRLVRHSLTTLTREDWSKIEGRNEAGGVSETMRSIDDAIGSETWRADVLADHYGGRARSSSLTIYLFGAIAVLGGLLGFVTAYHSYYFIEIIMLIFITFQLTISRLRHWSPRWSDYRLLAERLRSERLLSLIPGRINEIRQGTYDAGGRWVDWYAEMLLREKGLVSLRMDDGYINSCAIFIENRISEYRRYFARVARSSRVVHRRLSRMRANLFFCGVLGCLLLIVTPHDLVWLVGRWELFLVFVAVGCPAFGVSLNAIMAEGQFEIVALRAELAKRRLDEIHRTLVAFKSSIPKSFDLRKIVEEYASATLPDLSSRR
jgi:hypothetical protein